MPCKFLWEPHGFLSLDGHYIGALTLISASWKRRNIKAKKGKLIEESWFSNSKMHSTVEVPLPSVKAAQGHVCG